MRYRYAALFLLLLTSLSSASQSVWDLGIDRVNLASTTVRQGETLKIAVYIRNHEDKPFFGIMNVTMRVDQSKIPSLMEFICIGNESICPSTIPPGFGRKDLPSRSSASFVFSLDTSKIPPGDHKLSVEVRPKGYVDPKTDDNTYVVSFTIAATTQPSMFTELLAIPVILLLLILILRRRKS
jgi:hypothetical protein